jgi:DNA-binding transcriptional regulator PaaX
MAHAGLGLDDADVDAMIAHVVRALADVGVSESGIQAALSRLEAVRHVIVERDDAS